MSENKRFPNVFKGYRNGTLTENGLTLKRYLANGSKISRRDYCQISFLILSKFTRINSPLKSLENTVF